MNFKYRAEFEDRCPGCNLNWGIWPPARIDDKHNHNMFRCIDCKRVYEIKMVEVERDK